MIIKKYKANSVEEAQEKIEEDLGSDAIILTSRFLKDTGIKGLFTTNQVEVTAAIEESDLEKYKKAAPKKSSTSDPQKGMPSEENLNENLGHLKEMMSKYGQETQEKSSGTTPRVRLDLTDEEKPPEMLSVMAKQVKENIDKAPGKREAKTEEVISTQEKAEPSMTAGMQAKEDKHQKSMYSPLGRMNSKPAPVNLDFSSKTVEPSSLDKQVMGRSRAQQMMQLGERLVEKANQGKAPVPVAPMTSRRMETPAPQKEFAEDSSLVPSPSIKSEITPSVDLNAIKDIIREEMRHAQYGLKKEVEKQSKEKQDEYSHTDMSFLISKGISRSIALDVEERVNEKVSIKDFSQDSEDRTMHLNLLKDELAKKISVGGPIELNSDKTTYVALVGSTGVGKTTTLAKLASLYAHVFGKKVAILNLDQDKFGQAPIRSFAREQQIESFDLKDVSEIRDLKSTLNQFDLVLVDTSGRNQYHHQEVKDLAEAISHWDEIQLYLTLSATTKDIDNYGTIKSFSSFALKGLIFTKLDETVSWGSLVNICEKTRKPICYLSMGKRVPEDLVLADGQKIAKNILLQHNGENFQVLQRIANS
ncbi:hypothetical protein AB751O23_AP_00020 [Chlamydiales bacterium SCGC AB-751-O23]|jgi:flagellar biosynthesis protein FlhF|nr:hypothetical protein AB751O23_AP_00020 [Chlamydiales bacterium SCGC AB-751-O23]